ncbi:SLAF7 protein, partial [Acrocephalus arundinaceus]|nr:SLAF7 protein [Acrocephalus arundinaceus]
HPVFSPHFLSPASAGDTIEVIGAVGRSVTLRSRSAVTDADAAFWNFGNAPIVTVPLKGSSQPFFRQEEFKTHFTVSERGRALRISQLSMEDAGTYTLTIGIKTSTFTLQVYKELAELRVTCEAQNCSDGSCSFSLRCSLPDADFGNVSYIWRKWDQPWDEGSGVLLVVNKSSLDEPEPVTCTARNAVSSRNVTVTTPGVLCSG